MASAAVNGIDLWFEESGLVDDPPVILLAGANAQATMWPPSLVAKLVSQGLRVVRFDWRDNGLSTWIGSDAANYGLETLASDVLGLMDHLGIESAQLVGFSMGGRVAQVIASTEPARVRSLTLVSTTTGASDLPPVPAVTLELLAAAASMDPEDAAVARLRHWTGDHAPVDEQALRFRVRDLQARGQNPACRHADAIRSAPDATVALAQVVSPTLVIHGKQDPLRPLAHGRAVASAIRGSTLVEVAGMGHEVPVDLEAFHRPLLAHLTQHAR